MKFKKVLVLGLSVAAFAGNLFALDAVLSQRVLYIGHRATEFEPLLKQHFAKVDAPLQQLLRPD